MWLLCIQSILGRLPLHRQWAEAMACVVLPCLLSNGLFAAAFSSYHYLTFLGYSELPFLHRCECFVYPIALVLVAFVLSLPLKFNCSATVAYIYFG